MARLLHAVTAVLVFTATVLILACLLWPAALLRILAISFGTTSYHFVMRLAVGWIVNLVMRNHADFTRRRYQARAWEAPLYELLRVRQWKSRVPTYAPSTFDPARHTWAEIAQTMCQAETVHVLCAAFSFLPLALIVPFGAPLVFILTSVAAALLDLCFVIVQRFNRPTVLRLVQREATRNRPEQKKE